MQRVCSSQVLVLVSQISQLAVLLYYWGEDALKFWRQQGCLLRHGVSPELIVRDCGGQTRMERIMCIHLEF